MFLTNELPISQTTYKNRFLVKIGEHIHLVFVENIVCFCSKEKATYIYTKDRKKYIIDYTLEQIENVIAPNHFFRINRGFIINITAIEDIINFTNSRLKITLKNIKEDDLLVSREKVQAFKSWLDM